MGFLDHSTNNILVDAVLTDLGRKLLSDNRGGFVIKYFSMADDEVDYTIIEKFGRSVGKEKISKNTPIFEAQTQGSIAMKNRLITLPDPTVVRLPVLSINELQTTTTLAFNLNSSTNSDTQTINIEQTISGESKVPDGMVDNSFTVLAPDRFLYVDGGSLLSVEPNTRIAMYAINAKSEKTNKGGAKASIKFVTQPGLDDTIFSIFSNTDNANTITSVVAVIGDQTGIRKDFTVTISR